MELQADRAPGGGRLNLQLPVDLGGQLAQIERGEVQSQLPGTDAAEIEHLVDHARNAAFLLDHDFQHPRRLWRERNAAALKRLQTEAHRAQGAPQFVGGDRNQAFPLVQRVDQSGVLVHVVDREGQPIGHFLRQRQVGGTMYSAVVLRETDGAETIAVRADGNADPRSVAVPAQLRARNGGELFGRLHPRAHPLRDFQNPRRVHHPIDDAGVTEHGQRRAPDGFQHRFDLEGHEMTTDVREKHRMAGYAPGRRRTLRGFHRRCVLSVFDTATCQIGLCAARSETNACARANLFEGIPYRAIAHIKKRPTHAFQNGQRNDGRCTNLSNSKLHLPGFTGGGSGRVADEVKSIAETIERRQRATSRAVEHWRGCDGDGEGERELP